jgi:Xaa-Pro aminopeptidase
MSKKYSQQQMSELQNRLLRLQDLLYKSGITVCLLEDVNDIKYFTNLDLSYGRLWVSQTSATLFVDARYIEVAKKSSAVKEVSLLSKELEQIFLSRCPKGKLAFDSAHFSFQRYDELSAFIRKEQMPFSLVPQEDLTFPVRLIKGPAEIKKIKKSASLLKKCYLKLLSYAKVGMSEKELATKFEIFLRELGAESAAFEPIIAFGKNAAMPHHRAGDAKLKKDQLILFDLGVVYDGYHSDMTRFVFAGKPDPNIVKVASVVKKAFFAALNCCRPGVKIGALDAAAREEMRKEGMEKYFTHSLGHGIGLKTHERPRVRFDSKDKDLLLEPGMIITIEPGLYFEGLGGVRFEDMILITEKGYENLTKGV